MKCLPATKSTRWILWMAVYAVLLWLLLILHRFVWLSQPMNDLLLLRFALFSVIVAGIINWFGWLGAQILWLITSAGIVLGMGIMYSYTYREMSGWEDLAGFLSFSLFTLGGFVLGLLVEGIRLLLTRRPKA